MDSDKEIADILDECMKMMDENINILNDMEYSLDSEKEDVVINAMTKEDLIDMVHEVADSARIKKAEASFVRRFLEST